MSVQYYLLVPVPPQPAQTATVNQSVYLNNNVYWLYIPQATPTSQIARQVLLQPASQQAFNHNASPNCSSDIQQYSIARTSSVENRNFSSGSQVFTPPSLSPQLTPQRMPQHQGISTSSIVGQVFPQRTVEQSVTKDVSPTCSFPFYQQAVGHESSTACSSSVENRSLSSMSQLLALPDFFTELTPTRESQNASQTPQMIPDSSMPFWSITERSSSVENRSFSSGSQVFTPPNRSPQLTPMSQVPQPITGQAVYHHALPSSPSTFQQRGGSFAASATHDDNHSFSSRPQLLTLFNQSSQLTGSRESFPHLLALQPNQNIPSDIWQMIKGVNSIFISKERTMNSPMLPKYAEVKKLYTEIRSHKDYLNLNSHKRIVLKNSYMMYVARLVNFSLPDERQSLQEKVAVDLQDEFLNVAERGTNEFSCNAFLKCAAACKQIRVVLDIYKYFSQSGMNIVEDTHAVYVESLNKCIIPYENNDPLIPSLLEGIEIFKSIQRAHYKDDRWSRAMMCLKQKIITFTTPSSERQKLCREMRQLIG